MCYTGKKERVERENFQIEREREGERVEVWLTKDIRKKKSKGGHTRR